MPCTEHGELVPCPYPTNADTRIERCPACGEPIRCHHSGRGDGDGDWMYAGGGITVDLEVERAH